MGFQSGKGTAGQAAVSLVSPTVATTILIQNLGPSQITIGGPGVTSGTGVVLVANALPVALQATHAGQFEDADDSVWVVSTNQATASATVGWLFGG